MSSDVQEYDRIIDVPKGERAKVGALWGGDWRFKLVTEINARECCLTDGWVGDNHK